MLEALIGQFLPYIVGALALIAGLFGFHRAGKQQGKAEAEKEQTADALDAIRRSNANREEVARMDDDAQLAKFDRLWAARRKKERR